MGQYGLGKDMKRRKEITPSSGAFADLVIICMSNGNGERHRKKAEGDLECREEGRWMGGNTETGRGTGERVQMRWRGMDQSSQLRTLLDRRHVKLTNIQAGVEWRKMRRGRVSCTFSAP